MVVNRAVYEVGIKFFFKRINISDVASAILAGRELQSATTLFVKQCLYTKVQTWSFMEDLSRMASSFISRCNGVFHPK